MKRLAFLAAVTAGALAACDVDEADVYVVETSLGSCQLACMNLTEWCPTPETMGNCMLSCKAGSTDVPVRCLPHWLDYLDCASVAQSLQCSTRLDDVPGCGEDADTLARCAEGE